MQPSEVSHASTPGNAVRLKPRLTGGERQVLKVLAERGQHMTALQLTTRTGMPVAKVRRVLELLSQKGFVARLNTVIDSWACRAPLHVLAGGAPSRPTSPIAA
jgi:Fe2+ or Zn2+ uptake regulation protein